MAAYIFAYLEGVRYALKHLLLAACQCTSNPKHVEDSVRQKHLTTTSFLTPKREGQSTYLL